MITPAVGFISVYRHTWLSKKKAHAVDGRVSKEESNVTENSQKRREGEYEVISK